MQNAERIIKAVEYIENNLTGKLDLKTIAAEAALSEYHFHRLFHLITGETPGNYIQRRRLSEAAIALCEPGKKVIDVAYEYGYSSSDAFSRAFTKVNGFNARDIKSNSHRIVRYGKAPLTPGKLVNYKEGLTMKPEIIEKDEFKLIGVLYYGDNKGDEIPSFWEKHFPVIDSLPHRCDSYCLGFCYHTSDYTEKGFFHYMPAVEVSDFSEIPIAAAAKTVPAHTYAVFTHKGPAEQLKDTYDFIYGTWLPHKKYSVNEDFDFEYYTEDEEGNSVIKIFIPVKKKLC